MVSGSFSLPSRGSFHLSLTVLYSIGHMVVFSLMRWSSLIPSGFLVSRRTLGFFLVINDLNYGTFTLFHESFQISSYIVASRCGSPLPRTYYYMRFGLVRFRSPLLSESLIYFLFLRVIRWFSSPGSLRTTIDSLYDNTTLLVLSFLIRISADQCSFATPRSFSQLVTSFFGAMYQGILLYALCSFFFDCFSQSVELFFRYHLRFSKILDFFSMWFPTLTYFILGLFKVLSLF